MPKHSSPEDCAERSDAEEVARAINEELADHLALAAAELARDGRPPEAAARLALEQFGDVRRTARQCWWIQQGDQVMRRYVSIGLMVVLALVTAGFIFPLIAKLRDGQQAMAADIQEVAQRLDSMSSSQQKLLEQAQAGQVLEIKGRAYLGDPAKPAVGAEIQLLRLPGMEIIRRLQTRDDGTFTSEALPPGDYALLAELVDETNWRPFVLQSKPIYLYPGVQSSAIDLDLRFRAGQVSLDLSRALPNGNTVGDYQLSCDFKLHTLYHTPQLSLPLTPTQAESFSVKWPIVGTRGVIYGSGTSASFYNELRPKTANSLIRLDTYATYPTNLDPRLSRSGMNLNPHKVWWAAGRYQVTMRLRLVDSDGKSLAAALGRVISRSPEYSTELGEGYTKSREFDVREGHRVNLRIHVPEELGPRLSELLAKDERTKEEIEQARALLPTIEVVSTTPISEPSGDELTP